MINVLIMDVDGVLTDGGIIYDENGHETKRFDVKDGLGIKLGQKFGLEFIIISGRKSIVTELRAKELGIKRVFTGVKDKLKCYEELKAELGISDENAAYIGDDLNDLALLAKVGFSATVADAFDCIKERVDFITSRKGGNAAVRELIEEILRRNGKWEDIQNSFCS
ncbi:MAG: 3-deoxy-D-manno-octulosonate 8-phosphate phosphatase [Denitrovibrio sp.]|nr:MAG: 3-deoxy-D-manno-octulosonate 8-phosphate phosphatase [Denitrovibrio sp.]